MKDLSLHLLDITENSIRAGATEITMCMTEDIAENWFILEVSDNGKGMPPSMCQQVIDPFVTSRTLRKVGLGLPLLAQRCELCEGNLQIVSQEGQGTRVTAKMQYNHIDRVPIGDIGSTLMTLIMAHPSIHYIYTHGYNEVSFSKVFTFDTKEIKQILGDVDIENTQILLWIKEYVNSNIQLLYERDK